MFKNPALYFFDTRTHPALVFAGSIAILLFGSTLFWPFAALWCIVSLISDTTFPKIVKIIIYTISTSIALLFNVFYFIALSKGFEIVDVTTLNYKIDPSQIGLYTNLFWLSEGFHALIYATMFYGIYRILRYKITPYSNIYVAYYLGLHTLMNSCPVTTLQNYFLVNAKMTTVPNVFFINLFKDYNTLGRVLIGSMCFVLVYTAYKQLRKLDIKEKYWFSFWKENSLNKKVIPAEMLNQV